MPERELTTTSYSLLALLAVQPFTTYELAQQMERSLADFWPRAQSVRYAEAKNLVAHGLATTEERWTGRRRSTVYRITAEGRQALGAWLGQPGTGPVLQFEALLQVAFADHGSLDQLRHNLAEMGQRARDRRQEAEARGEEYRATGGPYPDRLPVIALVAKYLIEEAALLERWTAWAQEAIEAWSGLTVGTGGTVPADAFEPGWSVPQG